MATFKLCIGDPASKRAYQTEVKEDQAKPLIGLNIGETVKGDSFGLTGYEFLITGGSDFAGFPMRRGILGVRKSLVALGGVGFRRKLGKGVKQRKTVGGHKISASITQINMKVMKEGSKKLEEMFPSKPKEGKEEKTKEGKEERKEAPEAKAEKKEAPKEAKEEKKEAAAPKPEAKSEKKEEPKAAAEKPAEKK